MADQRALENPTSAREYRQRGRSSIPEDYDRGYKTKERTSTAKAKDATVEVTVKVKKRREKTGEDGKKLIPIPEQGFRKGSWGDLLSANSKTSVNKRKDTDPERGTKSESSYSKNVPTRDGGQSSRKSCMSEHSPLCQKIPITDDLYLETHTHVRKLRPVEEYEDEEDEKSLHIPKVTTTVKHTALLKENQDLREEVERLRKEMEISRNRGRAPGYISKPTSAVNKQCSYRPKSRAQTQGTQTSTANLVTITSPRSPPSKKSGSCQTDTDINSPLENLREQPIYAPVNVAETSQFENLRLEKENEALRREATQLLTQVNKARADYLECYNTMKELYHIAANLKQENNNLSQNHQQQQTLHGKLLQALAENREIKEILDTLMNKQKSSQDIQDDQLIQIRDVIKDVKRTIAQEMEDLQLEKPKSKSVSPISAEKDNNMNAAFRLETSFLNDTNASEIQHIFNTQPPEMRRGMIQEDRSSSTQYLTLAGISSSVDNHYRPSPCADTKFSPRISTPNSSDISFSLSEVAVGGTSFRPIRKEPITSAESLTSDTGNEWKKLEAELARSFSSVRNELYQSTSSYSNSSTSSSPNPIRRK